MTDCENLDEIKNIAKIFRKHSYADQLEQVRVANVKSLTKVLKKLDLAKYCQEDIFMSILFILNDEHPEIRAYFVQSQGAQKLVVKEKYSLKSPSLTTDSILIDVNEQVLTESVLETALACDAKSVVNSLLVQGLILNNPYREHTDKNFDDKIFFFKQDSVKSKLINFTDTESQFEPLKGSQVFRSQAQQKLADHELLRLLNTKKTNIVYQ